MAVAWCEAETKFASYIFGYACESVQMKVVAYRHACHCEVQCCHVHGFFARSVDDLGRICVIHPNV